MPINKDDDGTGKEYIFKLKNGEDDRKKVKVEKLEESRFYAIISCFVLIIYFFILMQNFRQNRGQRKPILLVSCWKKMRESNQD